MSDEPTESELIAGYIKWAQVNCINISSYSYEETYEYICRYLTAAG